MLITDTYLVYKRFSESEIYETHHAFSSRDDDLSTAMVGGFHSFSFLSFSLQFEKY